jgi:predicted enzyme related to lactoylglutathione lyase
MIKRFVGASIAVKAESFDTAIVKYSTVFGVEPTLLDEDSLELPGIKGAVFRIGGSTITLLTGSADTTVARFCQTRGEGVFLLVCECDDVHHQMKRSVDHGAKFTTEEPLPFPGGLRAWAHPKSMNGVQWEFIRLDRDIM